MKSYKKTIEDEIYERERNALIPQAEALANAECGPVYSRNFIDRETWAAAWNKKFFSHMDALAREKGLMS